MIKMLSAMQQPVFLDRPENFAECLNLMTK